MNGKKEIIEYRTPNTKHFLKKDGTIEVEIYKDPVHYLEKGEYKEIDNGYILKTNNHDIPYQRYFYLINNPLEGYFFNECEDNPLYDYVSFKDVKEKNDLQPAKYFLYWIKCGIFTI